MQFSFLKQCFFSFKQERLYQMSEIANQQYNFPSKKKNLKNVYNITKTKIDEFPS